LRDPESLKEAFTDFRSEQRAAEGRGSSLVSGKDG